MVLRILQVYVCISACIDLKPSLVFTYSDICLLATVLRQWQSRRADHLSCQVQQANSIFTVPVFILYHAD